MLWLGFKKTVAVSFSSFQKCWLNPVVKMQELFS